MKKLVIFAMMLMFLITSCSINTPKTNNDNTDNNAEENVVEIDRSEYLTGEIITDGNYEISSGGIGSICFVPDKESREIIKDKYSIYDLYYLNDESYFIYYDNLSVTENLPKDLGIYKVKVKFDLKNIYNYDRFNLIDITLFDNIGTILYEGKSYETNDLDLDVKVKDRVLGLIVDSVDKFGDEGFRVSFCGEIETEGYYNIFYGELHGRNLGIIYYDEKYEEYVPMMMGESNNKQLFYFVDNKDLFSQLEDYSSFGRGKFKISNFHIVYKHGMGREPSEILTEIVSLDEGYKNMFEITDKAETNVNGYNDNFAIVSIPAEYDENNYAKSFDYYYINKNISKKVHLLTTEDNYFLGDVISETEFVLKSEGYDEKVGAYGVLNEIKCKITDQGAVLTYPSIAANEKIDKFNLSAIDDNYNRIATDGNYIYYIDIKTNYINRIRLDGTGNETISKQKCYELYYYDGKLYFQGYKQLNSWISCIDTDGGNYQIIYGDKEKLINNFIIHDDIIYMTVFVEEQEAGYAYGFYKYNLLNGEMETFDDSIALPQSPGLRLINDKIYYRIDSKIREYDINSGTVTEYDTVIDNIQEYNDCIYTNSRYSIMRHSMENISEYDKIFEIDDGFLLRKISIIDDLIFFTYCHDYTKVDKSGIYVDVMNIDGTNRKNLFYFDYSTLGHYAFDTIYVLNDKLFVISRDNEYPIFKVFDFEGNELWSL
ncbi:hypothetical protein [Sedimentibacter saalensis]|uniref:hypothetical protein n=1 Tax=Sedimentibacter saalensis TaxID=130788 RepID=UPI00289BC219|nr:hypothetical protein [Sedimentibacter saalensis]MEA5094183.1 hypothetical protein [Sedimentibacter saalensis]